MQHSTQSSSATHQSQYLTRLSAVRDYYKSNSFQFNHKSSNSHQLQPSIVFLDTDQGVARAGDAIADGWPVVTDYGSTYGTSFPPSIRNDIAVARKEQGPLNTVSVVAMKKEAYSWIDYSLIHSKIKELILQGALEVLEGIAFVRYPANALARSIINPSCIGPENRIQVFITSDDDPLMSYLKSKHSISFIAVRSSNFSGELERSSINGAMKFASEIGAPLFAIRNLRTFHSQIEDEENEINQSLEKLHRKRVGSQPIVCIANNNRDPVLTICRTGNTHPDTLVRLLGNFTKKGIKIITNEERTPPPGRRQYQVDQSITEPLLIRRLLLEASNLL